MSREHAFRPLPEPRARRCAAGVRSRCLLDLQRVAGNRAVGVIVQTTAASRVAAVQRSLYLGPTSTTPVAWDSLDAKQRGDLVTAANGLPEGLLRNIYFRSGYYRFADWNAFLVHVANPSSPARAGTRATDVFGGRDKAYGLEKPREKHIAGVVPTDHPTIDVINNKLGMKMDLVRLHMLKDGEVKEYAQWLYFHQRYSPNAAVRAAAEDKAAHKPSHGVEAETIKKSCKAAIEYTTRVQKSTVHFELDGIDFGAVVGKHNAGGWGITAAELRYIYRQVRRAGKGEADLSKVKFYLRGVEIDPPWVTEPALWQQYVPKGKGRAAPPARVALPSVDAYKDMKKNATRPGKHGMLSSKKYGKHALAFDRAAGSRDWVAAGEVLDTVHARLLEMRDTKKNYWQSEDLRKRYFDDPIFAPVEELRAVI